MEEIKKSSIKLREIRKEMLEINKRKPTEKELDDLIKILNETDSSIEESVEEKIAIKRENNDIEQARI